MQTLGMAAAGGLLALAAALFAWFALSGSSNTTPARAAPPPAAFDSPLNASEAVDLANAGSGDMTGTRGMYIRLEDPDTQRVTSEMTAERLEPLGQNVFDVEDPIAWLYLANGRTVHIRADEGRVLMPSRQTGPESGTFRGDVRIRIYESKDNGLPVDLAIDEPAAEVRSPALGFDLTFGEIVTPDDDGPTPVEVLTRELTFAGRGLRLLVSEVNERIELLEVREGEYLRYQPRPTEAASADTEPRATDPATADPEPTTPDNTPTEVASGKAPSSTPSDPATPAPDAPIETLYYVTFDDAVKLDGEGRTIEGDRLELWARLIDNELPEGAIAGADPDTDDDASTATTVENTPAEVVTDDTADGMTTETPDPASRFGLITPTRSGRLAANTPVAVPVQVSTPGSEPDTGSDDTSDVAADPTPDETVTQVAAADEAPADPAADALPAPTAPLVELTWTGKLRIVPIEGETPAELTAGNHLAGRFTAPVAGLVRFADSTAGASGQAASAGYFATTQDLLLEGVGPAGVQLDSEQGRVRCSRVELNFASGVVHAPGAGVLEAATRGSVQWQDQADFFFEVNRGRMTEALRTAVLQGGVEATDGRGVLRAEAMRTHFVQDGEDPARLRTLIALDGVVAEDGRGGALTSDRVDVSFAPASISDSADPQVVLAVGRVFAHKDSASIACESLETRLERDAEGDLEVTNVLATGGPVQFNRLDDDVSATTLQLIADARRQNVRLQGEGSVVRRGPVGIEGSQITLDGDDRTVEVFGAGRFAKDADNPNALPELDATWTSEMRFDDKAGLILAFGNVRADAIIGDTRADRLRAERLRIELATEIDDNATEAEDPLDTERLDREFLRAEAWGAEKEFQGGQPATFEARRYAPGTSQADSARLARLLYIRGDHIIVDNTAGTLEVPEKGELVLFDRSPLNNDVEPGSDRDRRGRAHFTWDGSMLVDRLEGRARIREAVTMRQRRERDDVTTSLECEDLLADFQSDAEGSQDVSLNSAIARGGSYLRSGERELTAEALRFDAVASEVDAIAPNSEVTLMDAATGRTTRAKRLLWEMDTGRVEIRQPSGTRGPG